MATGGAQISILSPAHAAAISAATKTNQPLRKDYQMAVISSPRSANVTFGGRVFNIIGVFAAWNDARRTRAALNALSSRELEDIGLMRADIDRVANF